MSAPKALQGSETETRESLEGMEENSVSPRPGVIDLPYRHINDFLQKGNRKKIELVTRPAQDEGEFKKCKELSMRMGRRAMALGGTCTGEHGVGTGKRDLLEGKAAFLCAVN